MKILIVGAGPIGCYTAQLLKRHNFAVELIEEHPVVGRPIHCAGLVSKEVLLAIKATLKNDFVVNHIDGAEFFFNGDAFKIKRKDAALIIDREKFDQSLAGGLEINFNTRFMGIEKEDQGYLIETDKGDFYADIVIGADGANSSVRKLAEFKEEIEYLRGVQFRIAEKHNHKNFVQIYLKHPFFAWVIPEDTKIVRVGMISHNPYHDLKNFLKEISLKGEIIEKFAGIVPLGSSATQKENLVLVGDAACQLKPLTHGGIYYGMRCAEILVDCILKGALCDYENLWKAKFGREIAIGIKIRRLYENLSHENVEKIFLILKAHAKEIEEIADFENHSKILSVIIQNPRLQIMLGKLLINIFKDSQL